MLLTLFYDLSKPLSFAQRHYIFLILFFINNTLFSQDNKFKIEDRVRVKPAAKQIGNRPNPSQADEQMISSISRGGVGGPLGKAKTKRTFNSSANKGKPDARTPMRTPAQGNRGAFTYDTVKINSTIKSKTADQAKANARGLKAANKPLKRK